MLKIIVGFLLSITLIACNFSESKQGEIKESDSVAFSLNNSAMDRYQNYMFGKTNDVDSLKLSLVELDKAIAIDSSKSHFYTNKVNVLLALKKDAEAIEVMESVISRNPNFAEGMTTIGFLYERNGEESKSQKWYRKALQIYDKRIETNESVVNSKINKAFLLFFTEGKETALEAFHKLKKEYPNSEEVNSMEPFFEEFDREEFINEFHT